MTLSTDDGARELRLAFIVNQDSEKILSDGALVAGMASTTLASFANVGYTVHTTLLLACPVTKQMSILLEVKKHAEK